jgi:hypothetical protein
MIGKVNIVYEYFTKEFIDGNRITGWTIWNTENPGYEDKIIFEKNMHPTESMIAGLYNGDKIPKFILNVDGTITESALVESEKAKLPNVRKSRFEKDYPLDEKLRLLVLGIVDKNNAEFKEYQRREAELI